MGDQSDSDSRLRWAAIIVGMMLAFPLGVIIATESPGIMLVLASMAFVGWAGVRTGYLDGSGGASDEPDPLTTLQDRYARGELSEAEFERRLGRILESEATVRGDGATDRRVGEGEHGREPAVERE